MNTCLLVIDVTKRRHNTRHIESYFSVLFTLVQTLSEIVNYGVIVIIISGFIIIIVIILLWMIHGW